MSLRQVEEGREAGLDDLSEWAPWFSSWALSRLAALLALMLSYTHTQASGCSPPPCWLLVAAAWLPHPESREPPQGTVSHTCTRQTPPHTSLFLRALGQTGCSGSFYSTFHFLLLQSLLEPPHPSDPETLFLGARVPHISSMCQGPHAGFSVPFDTGGDKAKGVYTSPILPPSFTTWGTEGRGNQPRPQGPPGLNQTQDQSPATGDSHADFH